MVVVQKQRNFSHESTSTSIANKVRRGDIRHAVVVRVAKQTQRPDGSILKFDDNACVLINKTGDPLGTRMNGQLPSAMALLYEVLLMLVQESWLRNYGESNGRKSCRWRLCMYNVYQMEACCIRSIASFVPIHEIFPKQPTPTL